MFKSFCSHLTIGLFLHSFLEHFHDVILRDVLLLLRLRCFLHFWQPRRVSRVDNWVKHKLKIVANSVERAATPNDVLARFQMESMCCACVRTSAMMRRMDCVWWIVVVCLFTNLLFVTDCVAWGNLD